MYIIRRAPFWLCYFLRGLVVSVFGCSVRVNDFYHQCNGFTTVYSLEILVTSLAWLLHLGIYNLAMHEHKVQDEIKIITCDNCTENLYTPFLIITNPPARLLYDGTNPILVSVTVTAVDIYPLELPLLDRADPFKGVYRENIFAI